MSFACLLDVQEADESEEQPPTVKTKRNRYSSSKYTFFLYSFHLTLFFMHYYCIFHNYSQYVCARQLLILLCLNNILPGLISVLYVPLRRFNGLSPQYNINFRYLIYGFSHFDKELLHYNCFFFFYGKHICYNIIFFDSSVNLKNSSLNIWR